MTIGEKKPSWKDTLAEGEFSIDLIDLRNMGPATK